MTEDKEFDVVIFGASGFTGALVCEYMATRYGNTVRWAMAGRNGEKLAQTRDAVGAPPATELIIADAADNARLAAMVARTKCVLTTTGPYQLYGSDLVAQVAEAGVDYVDLSGEPAWMHEMITAHHATAAKTGARIVHSCGFDSIPFDLGVLFLQNAAQAAWGAPAARVRARVRAMAGGFSGGTAASLGATMAALAKNPALAAILGNPFALADGFAGPEQPADNAIYEDDVLGQWVAPFIMAPINTKNIHRSNALLGHRYGKDFLYDEMMATGAGAAGKAAAEQLVSVNPLAGEDAPKPGEGPSRAEREAGHYDVLFIGTADDARELRASVSGDMDPGYGSTSKMIAEAALCLGTDCAALAGGVYTPAAAMGEALITRLVANAGLTFTLEG